MEIHAEVLERPGGDGFTHSDGRRNIQRGPIARIGAFTIADGLHQLGTFFHGVSGDDAGRVESYAN